MFSVLGFLPDGQRGLLLRRRWPVKDPVGVARAGLARHATHGVEQFECACAERSAAACASAVEQGRRQASRSDDGPLGFAHGAAAGPHDQQPQAHKPPPATGWEPAGTGAVGACRGIGAAQPTALQAGCAVAPLPLSLFSGAARYLRP